MKRRFYFGLLILAVILFAVPGFAAKAMKRITRSPLSYAASAPAAPLSRVRTLRVDGT
jgi:hypothetical protein